MSKNEPNGVKETESPRIYQEKQKRQLCLLHALNNLFQREEFEQKELDEICESLDEKKWFNAHRSWIGLGNYDANILLCALQNRGLVGRWFDKRLPSSQLNINAINAFIFNKPSTGFFPFFRGRHWFTVKQIGSNYFNLDSKLDEPQLISDIVPFINDQLADDNELLLVVEPENESNVYLSPTKEMP